MAATLQASGLAGCSAVVGSRTAGSRRVARPSQQAAAAPAPLHSSSLASGGRAHNPLAAPPRHAAAAQLARPRGGVVARGLFGLGLPEIAVIAGVAALIFGPSKLPELGKGLGKTVKSFQTAAKEFKSELEAAAAADDEPGAAGAPKQPAAEGEKKSE